MNEAGKPAAAGISDNTAASTAITASRFSGNMCHRAYVAVTSPSW
jgi:hypothetical protein